VARHTLFGAENDGLYEHMMHMVVEWEEMLISRGVCFRLFSMQAAEAYNQRLTRDLKERTQNHPLLTVGKVTKAVEVNRERATKKKKWRTTVNYLFGRGIRFALGRGTGSTDGLLSKIFFFRRLGFPPLP
jgi:hypothetical protein